MHIATKYTYWPFFREIKVEFLDKKWKFRTVWWIQRFRLNYSQVSLGMVSKVCVLVTPLFQLGSKSKFLRLTAFVLLLSAVCWRAGRDWFFFTEGPVCYRWWSSSCQRHLPENMEVIFCSRRRTCEARWWMIQRAFQTDFEVTKTQQDTKKRTF